MLKQLIAAAACAAAVLCGSGAFFRSRLDAVTSASAHDPRFPRDRLHGNYLVGVGDGLAGLSDDASRAALKSAFAGASVELRCPKRVSLIFPSGDAPLAAAAAAAVERLRACGLDVVPAECSPVMLRSRALAGKFDVLLTPARVILRSDVSRLGFMTLSAEELGGKR